MAKGWFQFPLKYTLILYLGFTLVSFSGCSSPDILVRDGHYFDNSNLEQYRVRPGDTLYSIAWHLDRNFKDIANANGIRPPYSIYSGQILQLTGRSQTASKSGFSNRNSASRSSSRQVKSSKISSPTSKTQSNKNVQWSWPVNGKLISHFSSKGIGNKGLDIHGKQGDPVRTAARGVVVYRGDALLGYGKIIIIKHNEQFLSAYAHNSEIVVNEGQRVKPGQLIAKIGSSGTDRNKLHFEIRREGIPVDPLKYLPTRK